MAGGGFCARREQRAQDSHDSLGVVAEQATVIEMLCAQQVGLDGARKVALRRQLSSRTSRLPQEQDPSLDERDNCRDGNPCQRPPGHEVQQADEEDEDGIHLQGPCPLQGCEL